jgi:hypothetical protein
MNTSKLVLDAWYDLLSGNISVEVHKRIPMDAQPNHVWLRIESGFDQTNKSKFNDDLVIVTEIITEFENVGDDSVMEGIDSEIVALVLTSPATTGLTDPPGVQILNIKRKQFYPPQEADGTKVFLRKISRYTHRIHQN